MTWARRCSRGEPRLPRGPDPASHRVALLGIIPGALDGLPVVPEGALYASTDVLGLATERAWPARTSWPTVFTGTLNRVARLFGRAGNPPLVNLGVAPAAGERPTRPRGPMRKLLAALSLAMYPLMAMTKLTYEVVVGYPLKAILIEPLRCRGRGRLRRAHELADVSRATLG